MHNVGSSECIIKRVKREVKDLDKIFAILISYIEFV